MKWRRTISLGLAAAMTASTVLAGCGGDSGANGNASSGDNKNQTAATEEGGSQASGDVTTIEVYDVAANYQGMQAGWFGEKELDDFIRTARERQKLQALVYLMKEKDAHYGYREEMLEL